MGPTSSGGGRFGVEEGEGEGGGVVGGEEGAEEGADVARFLKSSLENHLRLEETYPR